MAFKVVRAICVVWNKRNKICSDACIIVKHPNWLDVTLLGTRVSLLVVKNNPIYQILYSENVSKYNLKKRNMKAYKHMKRTGNVKYKMATCWDIYDLRSNFERYLRSTCVPFTWSWRWWWWWRQQMQECIYRK